MTANAARLGRRQIDALRAAKAGDLVRFDSGTWSAVSTACTQPARSVARLGLLAEAGRMFLFTFGAGSKPGTRMHLSAEGERVLAEVDRLRPELLEAERRQTILVRELAKLNGQALVDGVLRAAAYDDRVDDATFPMLAQAAEGRDIEL